MKKATGLLAALAITLTLALPAFAANGGTHNVLFHRGSPSGIIEAPNGSFLITDVYNKVIWQLEAGEAPVQLVGRDGVRDQAGEPIGGYNDSSFEESAFALPWDITPFLEGYLVSDSENNVVRYFSENRVQTAFGSGTAGYKEGRGMSALLNYPTGLAADPDGNAYVADTGNNVIRKMTPGGQVTTYAGTGAAGYSDGAADKAMFNRPTGLCWYDGALYVADTDNHVIRKIEGGKVTTIAGTLYSAEDGASSEGGAYLDGAALEACFSYPTDVAVSEDGDVYVSDTGNSAIRVLSNGSVSTVLKSDADSGDQYPVSPRGLLLVGETLLIADPFAGVVFSPDASKLITFHDVPAEAWFAEPVYYGVRNGLYNGTSENEFSPGLTLSRGMLVTVLGRMAGIDVSEYAGESFGDVSADAYYAPYMLWAYSNGIITGRSEATLEPDSLITREEIVTVLYRYARYDGLEGTYYANLRNFGDASDISGWADDAFQWAYAAGVVKGYDDGTLRPGKTASRAEMAQIIYSFAAL